MQMQLLNGANNKKILQVQIEGSLDYINGLTFENKILEAIRGEAPDFVTLDLSETTFLDYDGLLIIQKLIAITGNGNEETKIALIIAENSSKQP